MVAVGVALFFAGYTLLDYGYVNAKEIPGVGLLDMVLPSRRTGTYQAIIQGTPPSGSTPTSASTTGRLGSDALKLPLALGGGPAYVAGNWLKNVFK